MSRAALIATVFFGLGSGACAEEFIGTITRVDGARIEVQRSKGDVTEMVALNVRENCRIAYRNFKVKTKRIVAGEAVEGGLKNVLFARPVAANIVTDDAASVVSIVVLTRPK